MVFQAYIDDSADKEVFVLAGYIARFDAWEEFSNDWEQQLTNFQMKSFKMNRMAQSDEGIRRAEIFYRIIEKHVYAAISCTIDKVDLACVVADAIKANPELDEKKLGNAFFPAFMGILTCLPHGQETIDLSDPVDFIFDNRTEANKLEKTWELIKANADPLIYPFLGARPRFEDDEEFLPLQAADLFAWWIRRWEIEGKFDVPGGMEKSPFPWERTRGMPFVHIRYREHELRETMEGILSPKSRFLNSLSLDELRMIDEGRKIEYPPDNEESQRHSLWSRIKDWLPR